MILVHNHPSGSLKPSQDDKVLTDKVQNGLKLLNIQVLDHVILTESSYYSFANNDEI